MNITITNEQAIAIAHQFADKEGWPWFDPITVDAKRSFFGRILQIVVRSNSNAIGCNVTVVLDPISGTIIRTGFKRI